MNTLDVLNGFKICCSSCKLEYLYGSFLNNFVYVKNSNSGKCDYLMVRLNGAIFGNPRAMLKNIGLAMDLVREKKWPTVFDSVNFQESQDGNLFYRDKGSFYWQIFSLPSRNELLPIHNSPELSYEWANVFGSLLKSIDNYPYLLPGDTETRKKFGTLDFNKYIWGLTPLTIYKKGEPRDELEYVMRIMTQVSRLDYLLAGEDIKMEVKTKQFLKV